MPPSKRPTQMRNGRFTILRPLSQGGMGALYLATENIATGTRKVVIKEMLDYFDAGDPQGQAKAKRRFEAEAITLANLSIPGIPQVFDYFSENGRNYIVMQFIEGQNLESGLTHVDENGNLRKGTAYPLEKVRQWGKTLCKVLDRLAGQKIIHMDIKPANLIVDRSGEVWLVDFGTAKAPLSPMYGGPTSGPAALKKSSVYGTLGYAAPEQAAGKPDARSDVFALAATLYHLASDDDPGKHPGQFPKLDSFPADFSTALRRALNLDVRKRIDASEFDQLLEPRASRPLGFHWQDGTVSQDVGELAQAAAGRWEEACSYLSTQAFESWLQDLHRHDLLARLTQIKGSAKEVDLVLDAFLRLLDPRIPPARLNLPVTVLDAGKLAWQSQQVVSFTLQNTGSGVLCARLENPPPGIRLVPEATVVRERTIAKIFIDSKKMSPSARPQTIPITLNAGPAGRALLRLKLHILAPELQVEPARLELGSAFRGQRLARVLQVRNLGGSLFQGEANAHSPGWDITPKTFDCPAGGQRALALTINTDNLNPGQYRGLVQVRAQAGSWLQLQEIEAFLEVSLLKTLWRLYRSTLIWMVTGAFLTGFLGWFLATLVGGVEARLTTWYAGALAGLFLGLVLCLFPALSLGVIGWLGAPPGLNGLHTGALIGGLSGGLTGLVSGAFLGWWGSGIELFGLLVGSACGLVSGGLLQRFYKR